MIKDRIRQVLEVKRAPKEKTYKTLGVTSANFRSKARETPVNSDVIGKLFALFPDINLQWLFTGTGSMFSEPSPTVSELLDRNEQLVRENERLRLRLEGNDSDASDRSDFQ
jgi:hypothetical protein